jgi:hypothetical protein
VHVVHIPKNQLMLIAGLVWCAAGAMVCMIGLPLEFGLAPSNLILFPLAVVIFLVFYVFVFSRLVRKHTGRIRCGVRFLGVFARHDVLTLAPERLRSDT